MPRTDDPIVNWRSQQTTITLQNACPWPKRNDVATLLSYRLEHDQGEGVSSEFEDVVEAFLIDRQARGLSNRTIQFYQDELRYLGSFLRQRDVKNVLHITTEVLRRYLLELGQRRNPGGVHASYRSIRAFFRWYNDEIEPSNWRNPVTRIVPPKLHQEPLEPIPLDDLKAMLNTCCSNLTGVRDRAILLCLLDTGCRASEFVALNVGDVDLESGTIAVRQGKGSKHRKVMIGAKCRTAIRRYLHLRGRPPGRAPLWATQRGKRLTYAGLRQIIRRRAEKVGLHEPGLHAFRRTFALSCLRNGMDVFSLQRLIGHADLSMLRRYLAQTEEDLRAAHEKAGPVDNLL